jgi:hypothetical protein
MTRFDLDQIETNARDLAVGLRQIAKVNGIVYEESLGDCVCRAVLEMARAIREARPALEGLDAELPTELRALLAPRP